jgi:hypothetical protein
MRLTWLPNGWKDYLYWQENDRKTLLRVNELIRDTLRIPFPGIGKARTASKQPQRVVVEADHPGASAHLPGGRRIPADHAVPVPLR